MTARDEVRARRIALSRHLPAGFEVPLWLAAWVVLHDGWTDRGWEQPSPGALKALIRACKPDHETEIMNLAHVMYEWNS